ncbi:MAG: serine/threonine protein kinase [Planctomycetaceae bacterium]|nr:serine/threonine protein kinase [Planctomycetaceae bacterium]
MMQVQDIFLAALEIDDLQERAAYIAKACERDEALLRKVKALLTAHERSGEFLDVPALQQMAGAQAEDHGAMRSREIDEETDLSFLEPSTRPGSLGRLLHYDVEAIIGRGGCGIVLKAFDAKLHRIVAIKVMTPELAATSPARKRFLREARATAAVRHDNVVSIHAVEEQPLPFLVMEYIDGQTLQDAINATGPLSIHEVVSIGRQIASGLEAAHAQGLIHRDIKPANILLENGSERPRITDFGLARSSDDASLTRSGVISGTPLYMSPEQAQGLEVDHRSDLFSLGSVLYVMSCGRPPFRASTAIAVLKRVVEDQPRAIHEILPDVPEWLTSIIARLHAKKPQERFSSAREVIDLLDRGAAAIIPGKASHNTSRTLSRRTIIAIAAMAFFLPAFLALAWLVSSKPANQTAIRTPVLAPASVPANTSPVVANLSPSKIAAEDHLESDRRAAESVIALGGNVRLRVGGKEIVHASKPDQIPHEAFVVTGVVLDNKSELPENPLADLRECREIEELSLNTSVALRDRDLAVLKEFTNLRIVTLNNNHDLTGDCLKYLANSRQLSSLFAWGVPIRDADLVHLSGDHLVHCDFGGTKCTDNAAATIAGWKNLKRLRLAWTDVTDRCLKDLKLLPDLELLLIYHTNLTDAGLADLAQCRNLRHVSVTETKVTDAGIEKLRLALPRCVIIGGDKRGYPQLEPDYSQLASGTWQKVLTSEEEFINLVENAPFRKAGSKAVNQHEENSRSKGQQYENGILRLEASSLYFPSVSARNAIIRAKVEKESGRSLHLHFRTPDDQLTYTFVYDFTDYRPFKFSLGRIVNGQWTTLVDYKPDGYPGNELEIAMACVGRTLKGYVDGRQILEYEDGSIEDSEFPTMIPGVSALSGPESAVGIFKDVEVQLLPPPSR